MTKAVTSESGERGRSVHRSLRLLLVDDHELVRSGLRLLLESSLGHSVTEATSGEQALDIVRSERFDLVLLDVRMPGKDGLWTLERLRTHAPDVPVLMLSTYDDEESVRGSLERGAAGYVLKEAGVAQVAEAIGIAVERRGVYLHPLAAERVVWRHRAKGREDMTDRELDVLTLIVEGTTNEEIARELSVTEKTVKSHVSAIFRKLQVTNRTQAATKAIREDLLDV